MSLRRRLVLWYGALFTLALVSSILLTYAIHVRSHYDDRDRVLVTSANHAAAEAASMGRAPHIIEQAGGLEVALRLYNADGTLLEISSGAPGLPPSDPRAVLRTPAGPAYDRLAGLVPPLLPAAGSAPDGAFGLVAAPDQRWRTFILPLRQGDQIAGYIEALTPLGALDSAIAGFRLVLLGLGGGILAVTLVGSAAIAGRALRPVAEMTTTARTIAASRDFAHRIPLPARPDELGRLAGTFNAMLASLEEAYQAQQRFVGDASHELRAPLTAIQANLELLERVPDMTPADRQEAITEASREAHRLARLVADLLTLARADGGVAVRQQIVDLDQVVLEVLGEARHLAQGQRLAVGTLEAVQVAGDPDRLKQLLLILVDHAIKYTPAGGQITLDLARGAQQAELRVRDTGVGIPAPDLPHVFERFYRADPARARDSGGTGLGLAIAHWIVEQHQGTIDITSTPPHGTSVAVALPLIA